MGRMTYAALAALTLTGCDDPAAPCAEREVAIDILDDSFFAEAARAKVTSYRARGWECDDGEPMLDEAGASIGTAYRCTICD